jgi:hypothetical protein
MHRSSCIETSPCNKGYVTGTHTPKVTIPSLATIQYIHVQQQKSENTYTNRGDPGLKRLLACPHDLPTKGGWEEMGFGVWDQPNKNKE